MGGDIAGSLKGLTKSDRILSTVLARVEATLLNDSFCSGNNFSSHCHIMVRSHLLLAPCQCSSSVQLELDRVEVRAL